MTSKKTPEEWGIAYKKELSRYEKFTNKLKNLIIELLQKHNIEIAQIESRTKSVESFVEKIKRKDYSNPLEEITDLVGIRIITYYKEDVDKIGEIIKKEFEVDWGNSIDKAQTLDPDRFGYLSVHYVVSLSSSRKELTEWKDFKNIKAEIQVRTVLQHAWAAIDHKLRYKTAKEVPKNLRRQLFRLSALLELADEEFSSLRERIEKVEERYLQNVEVGRLDIELDLNSLEIYFNATKQYDKWEEIAHEIGFPKIAYPKEIQKVVLTESKRFLLKILNLVGIKTLKELDAILKDAATNWGKEVLSNFYEISLEREISIAAIPHNIIGILALYKKRNVIDQRILKQIGFEKPHQEVIIELLHLNNKLK